MSTKPALTLVGGRRPSDDAELVQVLRELVELAERGDIDGLSFVATKGRQLMSGTAGEARRNPIFTLGAVRVLEDQIMSHLARRER